MFKKKLEDSIPKDVLVKEGKIDSLRTTNEFLRDKKLKALGERISLYGNRDTNSRNPSLRRDRKKFSEQRWVKDLLKEGRKLTEEDSKNIAMGISFELAKELNSLEDERINEKFVSDFVRWIQGESMDEDVLKKSFWWWKGTKDEMQRALNNNQGQYTNLTKQDLFKPKEKRKLVGKDFNAYLDEFVGRKIEFQKKMTLLKNFIPSNIEEAWLFWKYVIHEMSPLETDFMKEYFEESPDDNVPPEEEEEEEEEHFDQQPPPQILPANPPPPPAPQPVAPPPPPENPPPPPQEPKNPLTDKLEKVSKELVALRTQVSSMSERSADKSEQIRLLEQQKNELREVINNIGAENLREFSKLADDFNQQMNEILKDKFQSDLNYTRHYKEIIEAHSRLEAARNLYHERLKNLEKQDVVSEWDNNFSSIVSEDIPKLMDLLANDYEVMRSSIGELDRHRITQETINQRKYTLKMIDNYRLHKHDDDRLDDLEKELREMISEGQNENLTNKNTKTISKDLGRILTQRGLRGGDKLLENTKRFLKKQVQSLESQLAGASATIADKATKLDQLTISYNRRKTELEVEKSKLQQMIDKHTQDIEVLNSNNSLQQLQITNQQETLFFRQQAINNLNSKLKSIEMQNAVNLTELEKRQRRIELQNTKWKLLTTELENLKNLEKQLLQSLRETQKRLGDAAKRKRIEEIEYKPKAPPSFEIKDNLEIGFVKQKKREQTPKYLKPKPQEEEEMQDELRFIQETRENLEREVETHRQFFEDLTRNEEERNGIVQVILDDEDEEEGEDEELPPPTPPPVVAAPAPPAFEFDNQRKNDMDLQSLFVSLNNPEFLPDALSKKKFQTHVNRYIGQVRDEILTANRNRNRSLDHDKKQLMKPMISAHFQDRNDFINGNGLDLFLNDEKFKVQLSTLPSKEDAVRVMESAKVAFLVMNNGLAKNDDYDDQLSQIRGEKEFLHTNEKVEIVSDKILSRMFVQRFNEDRGVLKAEGWKTLIEEMRVVDKAVKANELSYASVAYYLSGAMDFEWLMQQKGTYLDTTMRLDSGRGLQPVSN